MGGGQGTLAPPPPGSAPGPSLAWTMLTEKAQNNIISYLSGPELQSCLTLVRTDRAVDLNLSSPRRAGLVAAACPSGCASVSTDGFWSFWSADDWTNSVVSELLLVSAAMMDNTYMYTSGDQMIFAKSRLNIQCRTTTSGVPVTNSWAQYQYESAQHVTYWIIYRIHIITQCMLIDWDFNFNLSLIYGQFDNYFLQCSTNKPDILQCSTNNHE